MRQPIAPIACKPWALNGLSERLIASHYEYQYGAAIRSLNALRAELETLDLAAAVRTATTWAAVSRRRSGSAASMRSTSEVALPPGTPPAERAR